MDQLHYNLIKVNDTFKWMVLRKTQAILEQKYVFIFCILYSLRKRYQFQNVTFLRISLYIKINIYCYLSITSVINKLNIYKFYDCLGKCLKPPYVILLQPTLINITINKIFKKKNMKNITENSYYLMSKCELDFYI